MLFDYSMPTTNGSLSLNGKVHFLFSLLITFLEKLIAKEHREVDYWYSRFGRLYMFYTLNML